MACINRQLDPCTGQCAVWQAQQQYFAFPHPTHSILDGSAHVSQGGRSFGLLLLLPFPSTTSILTCIFARDLYYYTGWTDQVTQQSTIEKQKITSTDQVPFE